VFIYPQRSLSSVVVRKERTEGEVFRSLENLSMLCRLYGRRLSVLHNLFGVLAPSSAGLVVGSHPPARPLPNHRAIERQEEPAKLQVFTLPNGVRVLSESAHFPSAISLGVSIGTGTRDEDVDHSGICHALKNTVLKTNTRTNEQLNYCMLQMGGVFHAIRLESFQYAGSFLAHDTYDFLQMMVTWCWTTKL